MSCTITYGGDSIPIENAEELFIAFDLTADEADEELIAQLKNDINNLIKDDEDFLMILKKVLGLRGMSKKPFLQLFGEGLSRVITKGRTLNIALAILAKEEDQQYVIDALGMNGIRKCTAGLEDLAGCLEWLYGKMDEYFINMVGWEYFMHFINNGEDLAMVVKYLEEREEGLLLKNMGWPQVLDCIQSPRDLSHVLTGLEGGNEKDLLEKMSHEKLLQVIPFEYQLEEICSRQLSPPDAKLLMKKYKTAGGK